MTNETTLNEKKSYKIPFKILCVLGIVFFALYVFRYNVGQKENYKALAISLK